MKKAVALLLILVFLMTFVSVSFASSGKLTGLERAYDRAGSRSQGKAPEVLSGLLDRETDTKTLIVNKVGEGFIEINGAAYDLPYVGEHEEGFEVELKAIANEGWEFYAWTGENVSDVAGVLQEETTIIMDGDKNITAFFADESKDKYYINLNIVTFKGAEGEVVDLTGHPPYPPGFEIELQAVPSDPNNHAFTHWALKEGNPGNILDASLYFLDISNPHTIFIMPDFMVTLIAHFTTWTGWKAPGEFDYDHNDFGHIKDGGGYGITQHYWNISDLNKGETLDFDFYAYWIPDRFRVYYGNYGDWGNWGADTLVFDSGWVSRDPAMGDDPQLYPEGVSLHEDNDYYNVMQSDKITTLNAGKYEAMIVKEEGKDVLMVEVEGRDPGTLWQYIVDRGLEPEFPTGKFQKGETVQVSSPSGLNLRDGPGTAYEVVWVMPNKTRMVVTDDPVHDNENIWWGLEGHGKRGWAFEGYLSKVDDNEVILDVLYIHQIDDTKHNVWSRKYNKYYTFNGEFACGATSAVMIAAYHNSLGSDHGLDLGKYVSQEYTNTQGIKIDWVTQHAIPRYKEIVGAGAFGYIHRHTLSDGYGSIDDKYVEVRNASAVPSRVVSFFKKHGLNAEIVDVENRTKSFVRGEIDQGRPIYASILIPPNYGHIVAIVGYTGDDFVIHDPYFHTNDPSVRQGNNVVISWGDYSLGNRTMIKIVP